MRWRITAAVRLVERPFALALQTFRQSIMFHCARAGSRRLSPNVRARLRTLMKGLFICVGRLGVCNGVIGAMPGILKMILRFVGASETFPFLSHRSLRYGPFVAARAFCLKSRRGGPKFPKQLNNFSVLRWQAEEKGA